MTILVIIIAFAVGLYTGATIIAALAMSGSISRQEERDEW